MGPCRRMTSNSTNSPKITVHFQHETKTRIVGQQSRPVWVLDCIQIGLIKGQTEVTATSSTETLYGILVANVTVIGFFGWSSFGCFSWVCVILKQRRKSRKLRIDENWIFEMKVVEKSLLFVLLSCMVCHTETDTPTSTFELFSNATKVAMLVREAYIWR